MKGFSTTTNLSHFLEDMHDAILVAGIMKDEYKTVLLAYSTGEYVFDGTFLQFIPLGNDEYFTTVTDGQISDQLQHDILYRGTIKDPLSILGEEPKPNKTDPAEAVSDKYFLFLRREDKTIFIKVFWRSAWKIR